MLHKFCLFLFGAIMMSLNVNAQNVADFFGTGEGTGISTNPYIITTGDQLDAIRYGKDKYYELGGTIDIGAWIAGHADSDIQSNGWIPIPEFQQTLDGNNDDGFKITGLWTSRSGMVGLFKEITREGTVIKDLTIELDVTNGIVGSNDFAGAIAGRVRANEDNAPVKFINCHVTGNLTGGNATGGLVGRAQSPLEIIDCSFQGNVSGPEQVGGLIGQKYEGRAPLKITNSYVINSNISSAGGKVGGLAGTMGPNSTVEGCYVSGGTVSGNGSVGGLIGLWGDKSRLGNLKAPSSIKNCFTATTVTSTGNNVGGLVGEIRINQDGDLDPSVARPFAFDIIQSYSTGSVTATTNNAVGGLVGGYYNVYECVMESCYTVSAISANAGIGGLIGEANECLVGSEGITINNSFALNPSFSGAWDTGRLIGKLNAAKTNVNNCYAHDGLSVITDNPDAPATLLTKQQLGEQTTYSSNGWDFSSTGWDFGNGSYYLPVLQGVSASAQPTSQTPPHLYLITSLPNTLNDTSGITVNGNTIQVDDVEGIVSVTNMLGVSQVYTANGSLSIPVAPGIYIVSINNASYKIAVK